MDAGQILLKHGLLSDTDLSRAVDARTNGVRVDQLAVEMGLVGEADALRALGAETGVDFLDLEGASIDLALLQVFPPKLIHRHGLFPIERQRGAVVVATSDPLNLYPLDEAAAALGCPVVPVVATREAIAKRIKTHLGVGSETIEGLLAQREEEEVELVDGLQVEDGEIAAEVQEASVVHLVNEILLEAIDSRASDVHIESQPSGVKIRYRIDGLLQQQPTPPEINRFQAAIISRLKIMARLNIAESGCRKTAASS
jgi:general secretion pathway protein E/type IV pilus assembly protein PilB